MVYYIEKDSSANTVGYQDRVNSVRDLLRSSVQSSTEDSGPRYLSRYSDDKSLNLFTTQY